MCNWDSQSVLDSAPHKVQLVSELMTRSKSKVFIQGEGPLLACQHAINSGSRAMKINDQKTINKFVHMKSKFY